MWFKDTEHQNSYAELRERAGVASSDREYRAALYVLAALNKPVEGYVFQRRIAFDALLKAARPWSSGEKALIRLAATLFNGHAWKAKVHDVFYILDPSNCQVALEALRIRYQRD
ncbi:hypothetical protein SY88_00265 [Clostridiales bacterium PH28_bin88]|nr:hypothetical protein SY88_00265 [Clostridiales bacterium PH28_bin88]